MPVNPAVAIGIIERRLALTDHPRARDFLLDMRARWVFARDMSERLTPTEATEGEDR